MHLFHQMRHYGSKEPERKDIMCASTVHLLQTKNVLLVFEFFVLFVIAQLLLLKSDHFKSSRERLMRHGKGEEHA
uniref:Ovule protein n=1 Tax=Ascaris lumbricoides TaxID=6252 RepID=A0A0M3HZT0_ASCLU